MLSFIGHSRSLSSIFKNQWMTTTKHEPTPYSRMKHTLLPTVCEQIFATWHSISPEIIENSFKVSGISN
jgi:hypothetical protein